MRETHGVHLSHDQSPVREVGCANLLILCSSDSAQRPPEPRITGSSPVGRANLLSHLRMPVVHATWSAMPAHIDEPGSRRGPVHWLTGAMTARILASDTVGYSIFLSGSHSTPLGTRLAWIDRLQWRRPACK